MVCLYLGLVEIIDECLSGCFYLDGNVFIIFDYLCEWRKFFFVGLVNVVLVMDNYGCLLVFFIIKVCGVLDLD